MADSKRELILKNIKTSLELITVANGYNNTLTADQVQRWNQYDNPKVHPPTLIINAGPERFKSGPNPYYTSQFPVTIEAWERQDERSTDPTDELLGKILADILYAMLTDVTRGGYAIETNPVSAIPFEVVKGAGNCGIVIEFEIVYKFDPLIRS
jgi:hypothetical protein